VFDLDGDFTTKDEISKQARSGCIARFSAYVGSKTGDTSLGLVDIYPPDLAAFRDSPGVTCLAVAPQPVTETFQGSQL
jgi:hypothetical protein